MVTNVKTITSNVTLASNEELNKAVRRIYKTAVLAAEKTVAHQADPQRFPMPVDSGALENLMLQRLRSRPQFQQARAAAFFKSSFEASSRERQRRLGPLGRIDLRKAEPVSVQAERLPAAGRLDVEQLENMLPHGPVFTGHDLPVAVEVEPRAIDFNGFVKDDQQLAQKKLARYHAILETAVAMGLTERKDPLPNFKAWRKLRLRILKTECVRETDGFLGSSLGGDEIQLGGYLIDASGDMKKVGILKLGDDFDSGDVVSYSPPKVFGTHTFGPESVTVNGQSIDIGWPRTYMATLILSEADNGGFPEFLDKLLAKLKEVVVKEVATLVGAVIGGVIGEVAGPLGAVIGALVGAAVGLLIGMLIDFFKSIWEDDVFTGVTVSQQLAGPIPSWGQPTSPVGKIWWIGHGGHYRVRYDWEMIP